MYEVLLFKFRRHLCEGSIDFYENLRTTLLESDYDQEYKIIKGGDFNVPLSLQLDSYGSNP